MWKTKLFDLSEIGLPYKIGISDISKFAKNLIQQIQPSFVSIEKIDQGSYGDIFKAEKKQGSDTVSVLIKQPRLQEMNLTSEAILQHIAHKCLLETSCSWGVPKVYEVFKKKNGPICFTMEYVQGSLASDWLNSLSREKTEPMFYLFLAQISLLLSYLAENLGLDHRDCKATNLFVCEKPCFLDITIGKKRWTLQSPFQIILLDFGFACLGDGIAIVNLGDGVLPPMDPCPKEGRDLFHFFVSILSLSSFSKNIPNVLPKIDKWLSVKNKSFGDLARRWEKENWVHLVTSQRDFIVPACSPQRILEELVGEISELRFEEV